MDIGVALTLVNYYYSESSPQCCMNPNYNISTSEIICIVIHPKTTFVCDHND